MSITVTVRNDDTRIANRVKLSTTFVDNEKGTQLHTQSTSVGGSETKEFSVPAGQTLSLTYSDVND